MDSCASALACPVILGPESISVPDTYIRARREHTFTKHIHYITQTQSYISPTTNPTPRAINQIKKNRYQPTPSLPTHFFWSPFPPIIPPR